MTRGPFHAAIGIASAAVALAMALDGAGAAPLGERKLVLASVKVVKCSNDAGKIVCPKGVTTIANEAAAWTKSFLSEASWACGPGKKEATGFELYWDYEDSAAHVGGDAGALEKLPACVKDRLIPPLLEAVPPIHFKAKASDPNVDVRYVLRVALTMQP